MIARPVRTNVLDPQEADALQVVATGGLEFAKQFYGAVARLVSGNHVSSPLSTSLILSMLAYGAVGNTKRALKAGLYFSNEKIHKSGLKVLVQEINNSLGIELKLASQIFVAHGVNPKPAYRRIIKDILKSSIQQVNFSDSQEASEAINHWAYRQTDSRIQKVVTSDDFDDTTRGVFVNVAYFNGIWEVPFLKEETTNQLFHFEDGSAKSIPTMHIRDDFKYGVLDDIGAKFAELPYKNGQLSMFIVLPDAVDGLKFLHHNFAQLRINQLLTEGRPVRLDLHLPIFEIETEINLKQPLNNLGMGNIFEYHADFSEMFDTAVKIDKAVQKTCIKVDEEGTTVAVITTLVTMEYFVNINPERATFRADHPFYYAIIKRTPGPDQTAVIFFQGHFKGNK